jgi:hypothetical protein
MHELQPVLRRLEPDRSEQGATMMLVNTPVMTGEPGLQAVDVDRLTSPVNRRSHRQASGVSARE